MKLFQPLVSLLTILVLSALGAPIAAQDPFLQKVEAEAEKRNWKIEMDPDKRWMLVSSATKESTDRALRGLQYVHNSLDQMFGGKALSAAPRWGRPAILFYLPQKKMREVFIDLVAPDEKADADWRKWARKQTMFAYPQQGYAFQKQSAASDAFARYLATTAVHLELVRRFGSYPYWVAEALSMAIQQESGKAVISFFAIDVSEEKMDTKWVQGWPKRAVEACERDLFEALWMATARGPKVDDLAPWFALGYWSVKEAPKDLLYFLELYALKTKAGTVAVTQEYHDQLARTCFGPDASERVAAFWKKGFHAAGTVEQMAAHAAKELVDFGQKSGMVVLQSKDKHWTLIVDAVAGSVEMLEPYEKQSAWVDGLLPHFREELPAVAFLVTDRDSFRAVCDMSAQAGPSNASYFKVARESSGFSSSEPPIVGLWAQESFPDWKTENDIARKMFEVKLMQRCGPLPGGMLEGLMNAVQELACGGVFAHRMPLNPQQIPADVWPKTAARLVAAGRFDAEKHLFAPMPTSFDQDHEILSYAFGVFMLDGRPKQTKNFFRAYVAQLKREGSVALSPQALVAMLNKHYGKKWPKDLQAYWAKR